MKKIFSLALIVLLVMLSLTACGKKSLPVDAGIEVTFSGVDGYGTASMSGTSDWMDGIELDKKMSELEKLAAYIKIEGAVEYELSPKEGLSNGDEVQVTIKVNNEILKEYGYTAKDKVLKFKVTGLEVPKSYNPFDHVNVTVTGTAPYAKLNIETTSDMLSGLKITADKTEGLNNGDVVKLKVETYGGDDLVKWGAQQGYAFTQTEMEYTVSGVTEYITNLEQIPDEWKAKIEKQVEDTFTAQFQKDVDGKDSSDEYSLVKTIVDKKLAGYYFLTLKDGFEPSSGWGYVYANYIIVVYEITATSSDGNITYYYPIRFGDGKIVDGKDFTLDMTDYKTVSEKFKSGIYYWHWGSSKYTNDQYYYGYKDLDSLFNKEIATLVEKYSYETTINK